MPLLDKPHLHEFINDLPVMLIWVDPMLNIIELNMMANHLLVQNQEPVIGQSLLTLFPALITHQDEILAVSTSRKKLSLSQQMLEYNSRTHPCYVTLYALLEYAGILV